MAADLKIEPLPPDWSYGVTNDGRVFFIRSAQALLPRIRLTSNVCTDLSGASEPFEV